jgi:hypothetical protein
VAESQGDAVKLESSAANGTAFTLNTPLGCICNGHSRNNCKLLNEAESSTHYAAQAQCLAVGSKVARSSDLYAVRISPRAYNASNQLTRLLGAKIRN